MKRMPALIALLLSLTLLLTACVTDTGKDTGASTSTESKAVESKDDAASTSATADPNAAVVLNGSDELNPQYTEVTNAKSVYTVENLDAADSRWDLTVANCGDYALTNREAQIHYFMQYLNFMNEYGMYAGMLIDTTKPLSEQTSMEVGVSWEQYFLGDSISNFHQYAAVATYAKAQGFTMPEEDKTQLESILQGIPEDAKTYNFDSVDAFMQASFGSGVRLEDYERFLRLYFFALSYENAYYESVLKNKEEVKAYFEAHREDFPNADTEHPNVNVRHLLIMVSKTDEKGEQLSEQALEAAKKAAKEKADALLADFRSNPTEEHFAELVKQNTEDPGSQENGGLYENVYPGMMVEGFNEWCFEDGRKSGDTDVVESIYGYHVMLYVKQTDVYKWEMDAAQAIAGERFRELMKQIPLTVKYEDIILASPSQEEVSE